MLTWLFWREALERALKSGAQAVLLAWGGGDLIGDLFAFDYKLGLAAAGGGVVLSLLTSIVSVPIGADNSPSLIS